MQTTVEIPVADHANQTLAERAAPREKCVPIATLLLSLSYLARRVAGARSRYHSFFTDSRIYRFLVLDVARSVGVDAFLIDVGEGAPDFAGMADEQAARRDLVPSRTSVPAATTVPAPMWAPFKIMAPMPIRQRDSMAQPCRATPWPMVTLSPRTSACLSRMTCSTQPSWCWCVSHADEVHVAANHGAGPDAGVFGDGDVADDYSLRIDVGAWRRFAGRGRGRCEAHVGSFAEETLA